MNKNLQLIRLEAFAFRWCPKYGTLSAKLEKSYHIINSVEAYCCGLGAGGGCWVCF